MVKQFDKKGRCIQCSGKGYTLINSVPRICPTCRGRGYNPTSPSSKNPPQRFKCPYCDGVGFYKHSCCGNLKPCPLCNSLKTG